MLFILWISFYFSGIILIRTNFLLTERLVITETSDDRISSIVKWSYAFNIWGCEIQKLITCVRVKISCFINLAQAYYQHFPKSYSRKAIWLEEYVTLLFLTVNSHRQVDTLTWVSQCLQRDYLHIYLLVGILLDERCRPELFYEKSVLKNFSKFIGCTPKCSHHCTKKMNFFLLKISSVNVTKSTGNWGFCHIYLRNC